MNVTNSPSRLTRLQLAYVSWLRTLGNPTHAVTLTFKRLRQDTKQLWSIPIIKKSSKVFLSVLNKNVFGKQATKINQCVMSVAVIGTGTYNDHPHAHLALQKPENLSWDEFTKQIAKTVLTIHWLDDQFVVEPYESDGWLEYMGKERLSVS